MKSFLIIHLPNLMEYFSYGYDSMFCLSIAAQYLGLPLVPPYIGSKIGSFYAGVNFAVAGATALDKPFFEERGVYIPVWNGSLGTQLSWFKDLLPSLCQTSAGKLALKRNTFSFTNCQNFYNSYNILTHTNVAEP